jgi:hypothetical protein
MQSRSPRCRTEGRGPVQSGDPGFVPKCALTSAPAPDRLGGTFSGFSVLNATQGSASATANRRAYGEDGVLRYGSEALKRLNSELDRLPSLPQEG